MIIAEGSNTHNVELNGHTRAIEQVGSSKYSGSIIEEKLSWMENRMT